MFKHKWFNFSIWSSVVLCIAGCHSVSGNVIPEGGPPMETIYDSMGTATSASHKVANSTEQNEEMQSELDIKAIRRQNSLKTTDTYFSKTPAVNSVNTVFHKLPNPELKLYVYPHLAGSDELPIPGYYTVFNVYEKTHYALPGEFPT